ncbi:MAG: glucosaminidase domain-containing protein [Candidatus Marsarchaeota archaeon]|nr:glucosaminidase domain-containing protein [Candidatus Marsarchaeota archaeon]MCL5106234.1 glucosaminidase domain-containing protein [Candidatus Marsarchaeota archaeon]
MSTADNGNKKIKNLFFKTGDVSVSLAKEAGRKTGSIAKASFNFVKLKFSKSAVIAAVSITSLLNPILLNNMNKENRHEAMNPISINAKAPEKNTIKDYEKKIMMNKAEKISKGIQALGHMSSLTTPSGIYSIIKLTRKIGKKIDVPWEIIFSQFAAESKYFTSYNAIYKNNLAGLGPDYSYNSLEDFGNAFAKTIETNFPNAIGANSVTQYTEGLFSKFKYCTWPPEFATSNGYAKLIRGVDETLFSKSAGSNGNKELRKQGNILLVNDNITMPYKSKEKTR